MESSNLQNTVKKIENGKQKFPVSISNVLTVSKTGNFEKDRLWFIQRLYEFSKSGGISIVLSGHAHKNRIYAIEGCKKGNPVRNINGDELKEDQKRSLLFIVTTSSAYISKEKATPGFRNLKFVNGAIDTELVTIKKI